MKKDNRLYTVTEFCELLRHDNWEEKLKDKFGCIISILGWVNGHCDDIDNIINYGKKRLLTECKYCGKRYIYDNCPEKYKDTKQIRNFNHIQIINRDLKI